MATIEEYRQSVVAIANEILAAGAHYLWGAAGATPDGNEGIINRQGSVNLVRPSSLDPANPVVFAAECSVSGKHICAGRYKTIEGGRVASAGDQDLIDYLQQLATLPEDQWQPFYEYFSPRNYDGTIVWGEDCRGKQHFDCVGLVNYCVEKALGSVRPVQFDIPQWATDNISGTYAVDLNEPAQPADVLINAPGGHFKHIGILCGTDENNNAYVIEAADTPYGVIRNDYNPGKWTHRRRLTAALLHG